MNSAPAAPPEAAEAPAETIVSAGPASPVGSDVASSMRNALKLGMGLLGSWAIALGIRLSLPRFLGLESFGALQFADAFTTTVFVLTGLGVETYVRKEIATRQDHASDFFGGTVVLGLLVGVAVMVAALIGLRWGGKSPEVLQLVLIMGIAQLLINLNVIYAALLHAVGKVDGLSYLNVGSKVAWGVGIVIALAMGFGVRGVAIAMLGSEVIRAVALSVLTRRHVNLRMRFDRDACQQVIVSSFPFFVGAVAQTIYARIDVSIMSFLTSDVEVGWYGAASTLAGISLLLSPLIAWILLPLTARAAAHSDAELMRVARRGMELVLVAAFPVSLFLWVGADVLIAAAFGAPYAPAGQSLRILAPTFVLTYAAIVSATLLVRMDRGWQVTWVSVSGMVLAPALNLFLVPRCFAYFGQGGAGIGAATSLTLTELYTTGVMTWMLGMQAFDKRSIMALAKTFAIGLAVALMDIQLRHTGLGAWRLVVDGLVYLVAVVATGALDVKGGIALARDAMASRKGTALPAA